MRQVAHHIWIRELLEGVYEEREGWEPNIMHTGRGDVSRVNVWGTVLSVQDQLVLDDGTGQVVLRAFEDVPGLRDSPGRFSLVIGRPRKYQDAVFLIPEVVRPLDPGWARVRKHALGPVRAYATASSKPLVREVPVVNDAERLIVVIEHLDAGDGVPVDAVIRESGLGLPAEQILDQLLRDGEIFEIRPGVVKVL